MTFLRTIYEETTPTSPNDPPHGTGMKGWGNHNLMIATGKCERCFKEDIFVFAADNSEEEYPPIQVCYQCIGNLFERAEGQESK